MKNYLDLLNEFNNTPKPVESEKTQEIQKPIPPSPVLRPRPEIKKVESKPKIEDKKVEPAPPKKSRFEQAKEQIGRTPYELPQLEMTPWMEYMTPGTNNGTMTFDSLIQSLEPSDFDIKDYQSHPSIKAPLSN